jgi:DNA-binding IclR family transcriptional regulator
MRHGTVMSLTGTASGWLFAAHRPRAEVLAVLEAERRSPGEDFEARLAEVRERGIARAVDLSMPGVSAMAAPVFDGGRAMVLSITAIGATASFDARWEGSVASALRRVAGDLSRRLGWQP